MIDSRDISELHPCLQRGANELKRRLQANYNYPMGISSTYRDNEAQDALYAQGRTKPGNIVTNAKGGQSIHNYRLAFDIFLNIKGQEFSNPTFFNVAGKEWESMGGEWGGSWLGFVDRPHMQFTGDLRLSDLQRGKTLDASSKMLWEANIDEIEDGDEDMPRYNNIEEIKRDMPWAVDTIQNLIDAGIILSDGASFDLSKDMIRMFVFLERKEKASRYKNIDEIKEDMPWAIGTIQELIDDGVLLGDGNSLDLSRDMIRTIVLLNNQAKKRYD